MLDNFKQNKCTRRTAICILTCYLLISICVVFPGNQFTLANAFIEETPLKVEIEVGSIHFRCEKAEFLILTTFKGLPIEITSLQASLLLPNEAFENLSAKTQKIATGLYKIVYEIPADAYEGTYALLIEARYVTECVDSRGTSLKSFLISPTLTLWNEMYVPLLVGIDGSMGTILTTIGYIQVNMTAVHAVLLDISENLATIKTDIGDITLNLQEINARIISLEEQTNGYIVELSSTIGMLQVEVDDLKQFITEINSKLIGIQDELYTIRTDLGDLETDNDVIKDLLDQPPPAFNWYYLLIIAVACIGVVALYQIRKSSELPEP